jgi:hypothetical protein
MRYLFRIALFVILIVHLVGVPVLTSAQESPNTPTASKRIYLPLLSQQEWEWWWITDYKSASLPSLGREHGG